MNQRNNIEFRMKDVSLDCEGEMKVSGYINVTERESETLYSRNRQKWFKETMQKGVFERALKTCGNIPCLLEHNWENKLANTADGTLHLREDNIGLRFDAIINDPDVYEQVRNRQINACSFGFKIKDQEIRDVNQRLEKTYVKEIELLEVSLVKNPAYVGSLVESRALEMALAEDEETNKTNDCLVESDTTEEVEEDTKELEEELVKEQEENTNESNETVEENLAPETTEEERAIEEITVEENKDVKEDVKEVLEEVIESKEKEIEHLENVGQAINEYKEDVKEELEETVEHLEEEKKACDYEVLKLKLEVLKLKEMQLNL